MHGQTPMVVDERDALQKFLDQCRLQLRLTAFGLTDDQVRAAPCASAISVGATIKHVAFVENSWMNMVERQPRDDQAAFADAWTMREDETLADVLTLYDVA